MKPCFSFHCQAQPIRAEKRKYDYRIARGAVNGWRCQYAPDLVFVESWGAAGEPGETSNGYGQGGGGQEEGSDKQGAGYTPLSEFARRATLARGSPTGRRHRFTLLARADESCSASRRITPQKVRLEGMGERDRRSNGLTLLLSLNRGYRIRKLA